VSDKDEKDGRAELLSDGKWRIKVVKEGEYKKLRNRFTMAHELAHIFLFKKFKWSGVSREQREYRLCERICDNFASRLLVPDDAIATLKATSPRDLLDAMFSLAHVLGVSLEVIARRVSERLTNVAVFKGHSTTNTKKNEVIRIVWGANSIPQLRINPHAHIAEQEDVGKLAFTFLRSCRTRVVYSDVENPNLFAHFRLTTTGDILGALVARPQLQ
jgi:hypothetical protein